MDRPELTALEARLFAIVESSDDAIIGTTLEGSVESWNTSAERITGWSRNEANGKTIDLLLSVDRRPELASVLASVVRGVGVNHFETVWVRKDGKPVDMSLTASPIRGDNGDIIGASFVGRDITQQKAMSEAGLWLAAIVQYSDDAIVSKDLQGIVTSWNPSAERMFGWTAAEAVGKSILIIVPDERRDEETFVLGRIRAGKSVEHFETVRRRKDGTLLDISLTVSPVKGADGRIIGASKVARDITERKRFAEEQRKALERERDKQAEANRVKDEFLATLSHELRTPLNAIIGWSDLMLTQSLDEHERQVALETIHRNARTQVQLVEDLLDVSRIVSGKLRLEMAPVDAIQAASSAIDVVRPAAAAKGITIRSRWLTPHLNVTADADRLQQIIWNLVSNAVKFTGEGGSVTITGEMAKGEARITVEDTGKGIPKEFLPHVFDRFTQEDSTHTRAFGGLGLGLAIVRHLVEAHGGSVEAHSEGVGKGASFTVCLPGKAAGARVLPVDTHETSSGPGLNGIHALVVDDLPDERRLLEAILTRFGARVTTAASVAEARRQLLEQKPDILVSDIAMPGEDGHMLARWIRSRSDLSSLPCIALTAHARADDRRAAFDSGFDYYLAKPVDRARLIELISAATRRSMKIA